MIRFTKKELENIKYVIVTMCLKDDQTHKIKGLFLGYKPLVEANTQLVSNDEYFVWIHKGENVYMLNADYYNVLSIEIKVDHEVTQYSPSTQAVSIDRLKLLHESLTENGRTTITGLIDIGTYKITDKIQKELNEDNEKKTASSIKTSYVNKPYTPNRSGAVNYSTYKKKEISTSTIKRTTKYPTLSAIEKMKAKIKELKDGKYELPVLPEIPADKEKNEDAKKSRGIAKHSSIYDEYDPYSYMME